MAHRLVTSIHKFWARVLANYRILQVQPIYVEVKCTLSPPKVQPKRFYKPSGQLWGNKSYLPGCGELRGWDRERCIGLGLKSKMKMSAAITGIVGIPVGCTVALTNENMKLNRTRSNNSLDRGTVEGARFGINVETTIYGAPRSDVIPVSIICYIRQYLRVHSKTIGYRALRKARLGFAFGMFCFFVNTINRLANHVQSEDLRVRAYKAHAQVEDFLARLWIQSDENIGMIQLWNPLLWIYMTD